MSLAVLAAAESWWVAKRPKHWTQRAHIADAAYGCRSSQDIALGYAVADMVKERAEDTRR
jgi:hypothetical protein